LVGILLGRSACHRLVQVRLLSFMSQYHVSVSTNPCATGKPRAATSVVYTSRPASFCPPLTMPNSPACLMALTVSPPAFASPMILAFDAFACSRNDEKSLVLSGWCTLPST